MTTSPRPFTLSPASVLGIDALAGLLTAGFSGYIVPIHFTGAAVAAMIERDDLDLSLSRAAWQEGEPVGIALMGSRARLPRRAGERAPRGTTRTLLAALGVAPSARRQGVGRLLLDAVAAEARTRGAVDMTLQVIAGNESAHALYRSAGFVDLRSLYGYTLRRASLRSSPQDVPLTMSVAAAPSMLGMFSACLAPDTLLERPVWQAEPSSLARFGAPSTTYAFTLRGESTPVGVCTIGAASEETRLLSFAILPRARRQGVGLAALHAVFAAHPIMKTLVAAQIIPAASTLVPFLEAAGGERDALEQHEMALSFEQREMAPSFEPVS